MGSCDYESARVLELIPFAAMYAIGCVKIHDSRSHRFHWTVLSKETHDMMIYL